MAAESAGGSELTQLVADHVLLDIDRHVLAAIMDSDGVTDEGREDGGATAPGLQNLLFVLLVHLFDPLQQLRGNIGAFLNASAHLLHCLLT